MTYKIKNKVEIPLKKIIQIMDEIDFENITEDVEIKLFNYNKKEYKMKYRKTLEGISIIIDNVDILADDVSKKGLRFPKINKKF
jgi:hypothetical protein